MGACAAAPIHSPKTAKQIRLLPLHLGGFVSPKSRLLVRPPTAYHHVAPKKEVLAGFALRPRKNNMIQPDLESLITTGLGKTLHQF
jgi:hypothetical protein